MSTAWELPGYHVQDMLGFGASGEVWRAREVLTGQTVVLKRLRPGAGKAAEQALHREAEVLAAVDTPYVVGLRAVVDGVLVLDHAEGGSVATLLAGRGRLTPGEVVTVAAPVAQALSALHTAGLVHGDLSPGNVLLTGTGMPMLSDLGLVGRVGEQPERLHATAEYLDPTVATGRAPDAASDVWALGALCFHLLAGCPPHEGIAVQEVLAGSATGSRAPLGLLVPDAPRALVAAVESALALDPGTRPTATDFAAALHQAQPAAPVRLTAEPASATVVQQLRETHAVPRELDPAPAPPPRRRPSSGALACLGLVVALLGGGLAWAVSGSGASASAGLPPVTASSLAASSPPSASPSSAAAQAPAPSAAVPATPDWSGLLDRLDARRARAFALADPALLAGIYVPGSATGRADVAIVRALAESGRHVRGVRHTLHSVRVRSRTPARVSLRVVDSLAPHTVLDARGEVLGARPGRGQTALQVTLVRGRDGWRIQQMRPST